MEEYPDNVPEMNDITVCDTSDCGNGSSGPPVSTSRWNPTKEQINLLESLYKQGIRTPSADQIQQITTRLRAFGHIEGKNVFYWFQNHKARQRQKQKQETMAYISRYIHRSPHPNFPSNSHPTCPNVVCGPYYIPVVPPAHEPTVIIHQPYNKVPLTSSTRVSSPSSEKLDKNARIMSRGAASEYKSVSTLPSGGMNSSYVGCGATQSNLGGWGTAIGSSDLPNEKCNQKTLALFPVSPTGILQEKEDNNLRLCSSEIDQVGCSSGHDQPFFNFFST